MGFSAARDLTEGSIWKHMLRFSMPIVAGNLFYQLYCFVDGIIAGRFLGPEALAAISATDCISNMFLNGTMALMNGFAIVIGQRFGAKDEEDMRKYVGNAMVLWLVCSAAIGTLAAGFAPQMLRMLNTPEEIMGRAVAYIRTRFLGIPLISFYNLLYYIFGCLGDGKTPFLMQLFTNCLNAVMDVVCIVLLKLDTFGAGLSSLIAVVCGICLSLVFLRKKFPMLEVAKTDFIPDRVKMRKLMSTAIPMFLQVAIIAVGSSFFASAVNSQGTSFVAATAASNKIMFALLCIFDGLASFIYSFVGQNMGAKRLDRVKKGVGCTTLAGFGWFCISLVVVFTLGKPMLGLFISSGEGAILSAAFRMTWIHALSFIIALFVYLFKPALQSMGMAKIALVSGVLEVAGRIFSALFLAPRMGFDGVILADTLAWLLAASFLVPCLVTKLKKFTAKMQK